MTRSEWSADDAARILAAADDWADRDPEAEPYLELYRRWYAAPARAGSAITNGWDRRWPPLPRLLRQAHVGSRVWSAPTPVVATGLAGTVVTRDQSGAPHAHPRGDYLTVSDCPGLEPMIGTQVRTLVRSGGHVAEGWWRTWGGGWRPTGDQNSAAVEPCTRIYFATRTDRVITLVRRLTDSLVARDGLRWQLKVAADPALLTRPDAVVLYLPDAAFAQVGPMVAERSTGLVTDRRPPFTRALAPGVGWAEDPGDGESFGESRCRLLAAAFAGLQPGEDPLAVAAAVFRSAGIDPAAPHLRPRRAANTNGADR